MTICTKNRVHYFGSIKEGKMILSNAGKIVAEEWIKTEEIRDRVQLGKWVVMPNHVHGIIHLKSKKRRDASHASLKALQYKEDGRGPSLQAIENLDYKNEFGPQHNNISSIVRGFKSVCTRRINESKKDHFGWQSGFYDHIIRSQKSLIKIEQYIQENPNRWNDDRYHS
ncbi:MAG: transposase [Balneolaceae bacterium]|nr:transposase [Balneolaceae bacterium]